MTFWHGGPVQLGRNSAWKSAHISWPAGCSQLLSDYKKRKQHLQRRTSARSERASYCGPCRAKTVRRASPGLYIIFVCAYILSTCIFCWRLYFVDANILSIPILCRLLYFVDANILLMPIFCRWQYFVDAYILLTLIFCRCRGFSPRLYLLNLLLIIVLCLYHDYF